MKLLNILTIFSTIVLPACMTSQTKAPEVARFVIINVLDKEAFDDCHIKGSIQVSFEEFEDFVQDQLHKKVWDYDTEIIVHCSNYKCTASWTGANALQKMGFKNVWAYEAGTAEARRSGLTVGECKASYLDDYEEPEGYTSKPGVNIIDTETLKKKMQEFALLEQA